MVTHFATLLQLKVRVQAGLIRVRDISSTRSYNNDSRCLVNCLVNDFVTVRLLTYEPVVNGNSNYFSTVTCHHHIIRFFLYWLLDRVREGVYVSPELSVVKVSFYYFDSQLISDTDLISFLLF